MTEQNIKVQKNNEYVIDKRYHLMDAEKTKAILQKSMDLAREEMVTIA